MSYIFVDDVILTIRYRHQNFNLILNEARAIPLENRPKRMLMHEKCIFILFSYPEGHCALKVRCSTIILFIGWYLCWDGRSKLSTHLSQA